jgi:hypothetical protein
MSKSSLPQIPADLAALLVEGVLRFSVSGRQGS